MERISAFIGDSWVALAGVLLRIIVEPGAPGNGRVATACAAAILPVMTSTTAGLASRLAGILGPGGFSNALAERRRHAADALRRDRAGDANAAGPAWVAWPRTPGEVQALVRVANATGTPLVPYGGGTGLMGGALPGPSAIVVNLTRMEAVRQLSAADRTVTAEAGVVLGDLDRALSPAGLMLGHDPWTVGVATVGGTISTDGLGYRGGQYGSMGQQVLGLEAVLPDGTLITTTPAAKRSTGPALHHLFIGGEGCFGIITAATLRVFPLPEAHSLYALRFTDFDTGFAAVQALFDAGLVPALLEYGEEFAAPVPAGWRAAAGADGSTVLYLGFEGYRELVRAQVRRALATCRAHGGITLPRAVAREFWDTRHAAAERFVARRAAAGVPPLLQPVEPEPVADFVHIALRASQVPGFRRRCLAVAEAGGVLVRDCGLWNRPELFSLVLVEPGGDTPKLRRAVDAVITAAQDAGGAMEYCHGVGVRLAGFMEREHGAGLGVLRTIKHALDPQGIMNPGKLGL
jgi:alkyldihydroxyacetonephosphate synthase